MAISFPITLPTVNVPMRVRWTMLDAVGEGRSPYTFSSEVFEHAGKRWGFEAQLPPMLRADAAQWIAAFASLRGRYGTFYFSPPAEGEGRGALTGTPLVKGASQTGGTLEIDGATAGVTTWAARGDWIQLGSGSDSRLHMVIADCDSDGSGNVTLELWPGPRTAPGDNDAVVVTNPKGVFRLVANERGWELDVGQIYGLSFSGIEAL